MLKVAVGNNWSKTHLFLANSSFRVTWHLSGSLALLKLGQGGIFTHHFWFGRTPGIHLTFANYVMAYAGHTPQWLSPTVVSSPFSLRESEKPKPMLYALPWITLPQTSKTYCLP